MEQAQGPLDALQILLDSSNDMDGQPESEVAQFEARAQATGMNHERICG